jgi:hypothetical protein
LTNQRSPRGESRPGALGRGSRVLGAIPGRGSLVAGPVLRFSTQALHAQLKALGVAKLGHRHQVASALRELAAPGSPAAAASASASTASASAASASTAPVAASASASAAAPTASDAFWQSIATKSLADAGGLSSDTGANPNANPLP